MTSKELDGSGAYVGVHLRGDHHRDVAPPGGGEQHLAFLGQLIPYGIVVGIQPVEHRKGIDDDQSDLIICLRKTYDLGDPVRLFLETMDLEYEQVPLGDLIITEYLIYPVIGETLCIQIRHLHPSLCDIVRGLKTDVGLTGTCLSVEQRHAATLDTSSQEIVE